MYSSGEKGRAWYWLSHRSFAKRAARLAAWAWVKVLVAASGEALGLGAGEQLNWTATNAVIAAKKTFDAT
ncbi:MAG TPA: hypothetical protein VLT36_22780 [Candidatus Dormibacteraeota bacterium]|nr:hypothetical protein [Candidatus Dormibacteraeota bacterium]